MYKAVREDDGSHIGLGGIGIFTSGLVEKLNALPLDGLSKSQYYLVNINTGEYTFELKKIVEDITESGFGQANMIIKINEDITRISGVVQSNSVTAEESADASEKLLVQANMLKELIEKFNL